MKQNYIFFKLIHDLVKQNYKLINDLFFIFLTLFLFILQGVMGFAIMGALHNIDQGYNAERLNIIGKEYNINFVDYYNLTHYHTAREAYIGGLSRLPELILYEAVICLMFFYCIIVLIEKSIKGFAKRGLKEDE